GDFFKRAAFVDFAVDLLLRWGADETSFDNVEYGDDEDGSYHVGCMPAEFWGYRVQQECFSAAEAAPVQVLLADAQKDRTWRRRGRLVLSRTFPDKVRMRAGGGGANARMGRRVRVRGVAAAASGDVRARGLNGVMTTVVGLEEGVFRNIVKFL
ncbi:unnamed protein product, partial [Ectocarpus sp. 6 AP-2014]